MTLNDESTNADLLSYKLDLLWVTDKLNIHTWAMPRFSCNSSSALELGGQAEGNSKRDKNCSHHDVQEFLPNFYVGLPGRRK